MRWLKGRVEDQPPQYLGELPLDEARGQPGNWIYDPNLRMLAYLPKAPIEFEGREIQPDDYLLFRVETVRENNKIQALSLDYIGLRARDYTP